jgi:hypothetical protein
MKRGAGIAIALAAVLLAVQAGGGWRALADIATDLLQRSHTQTPAMLARGSRLRRARRVPKAQRITRTRERPQRQRLT